MVQAGPHVVELAGFESASLVASAAGGGCLLKCHVCGRPGQVVIPAGLLHGAPAVTHRRSGLPVQYAGQPLRRVAPACRAHLCRSRRLSAGADRRRHRLGHAAGNGEAH